MNVDAFRFWNIDEPQMDLFFPVVIQGQIVQFTDTCVISKGSGDNYWFIKFKQEGSSDEMRYGWIHSGFEPDCDGGYTFYYVMEFEEFFGANVTAEEFEDSCDIYLVSRRDVIDLVSHYAYEYEI